MLKNKTVGIILPIHNQTEIIEKIIQNIFINSSENVKELIVILDNCNKESKLIIYKTLNLNSSNGKIQIKTFESDSDLYEVKSCNLGFKNSSCDFLLNVQDDMLITEFEFDRRLLKPFDIVPTLLGVSARDAVDVKIINNKIEFFNIFGKDVNSPRNILGIRDICNRGPLMLDHLKLQELDYLDESFAPLFQDDTDLGFRSYRKGYLMGAYACDYESPLAWGNTRKNPHKAQWFNSIEQRNLNYIIERHSDLILADKHGFEMELK